MTTLRGPTRSGAQPVLSSFVTPRGRARALRSEEGLSLIELMIAGFVLSVAVLALASVASTSLISVRDARERDRSTAATSSALEAIRALEFDEIALRADGQWTDDDLVSLSGDDWLLDHDGDGQHTEVIWATTDGAIDPYRCDADTPDCWFDVPADSSATVRVFVSWYPDATERDAKRITVVTSWDDPSFSGPRTVRMSTVVAPASRGIPVPAFEVRPPSVSTAVDEAWVEDAVAAGDEECLEHTLTNFGAIDRYDLEPGAEWSPRNPTSEGTFQSESWIFRAFFVPEGEEVGEDWLMRSPEATAPLRSPASLDTGEAAKLHLCYEPRPDGASSTQPAGGDVFTFTPTFHSAFDPNVSHEVANTITVTAGETFVLYLHDEVGHDDDHDRPWKHPRPPNQTFDFDQFPMNQTHPGDLAPPRTSLFDYDVGVTWDGTHEELDPDEYDGLWLTNEPEEIHGVDHGPTDLAAEWDHQFSQETAPITFTGTADVLLDYRLRPPLDDEVSPAQARVCAGVELIKLRHNGHPVADPDDGIVGRGFFELEQTGAAWNTHEVEVTWEPDGPGEGAGDVSFDEQQFLRLRLWNAAEENELPADPEEHDCVKFHIGYGAEGFDARLTAVMP